MKLFGNSPELLIIDDSILILVENGKNFPDTVFGLGLSHSGAYDVQELRELDRFVFVSESVDEGEDEGVSFVESQLIENLIDLSRVNGATAVLVEDIEGLLELIVVFSSEAIFP